PPRRSGRGPAAAALRVRLRPSRFRRGVGQYLSFPAAVALPRAALALCLPGGPLAGAAVLARRRGGPVARLGPGGLAV
ncbi:hypothetical protein C3R44_24135, partial [Mycobacterium tuberculosis]